MALVWLLFVASIARDKDVKMVMKQQEKNFLIGIGVFGVGTVLAIFLIPMLSGSDKSSKKEPPPNKEVVRVEIAEPQAMPPPKKKPDAQRQDKEPEPQAEKPEPVEPPKEATLVLAKPSKVPTDYFEDGSGTAELPRVVERYLDAVKNGSRFMGRLESIALRDNKIREEQRKGAKSRQPVELERGDLTKVISYNMQVNTPFLAARFDAASLDDFKGDVLVEWVDSEQNQRIELFFTPLSREGELGLFRLNMPDSEIPPASEVYVYSASDDMPLIASGVYRPE